MNRSTKISTLVLVLVVLPAASALAGGHGGGGGSGNKTSGSNKTSSNSTMSVKVAPANFNGKPISLDSHVCDHSHKTDKQNNNTTGNVGVISDPVSAFHPQQQTVLDLGLVATNVNNLSNVGTGGKATPVVRDHGGRGPESNFPYYTEAPFDFSGASNALTGGTTPPPVQMQKTEAPTYFTAQPGGAGWANATNVSDHRSRTGGK